MPLESPPQNELAATACPFDLFIHRTVQSDAGQGQRLQIWMLTPYIHPNGLSYDGNGQNTWEPAAIGASRFFGGVERFLKMDFNTGRPYWYSADSFERWIGRNRLEGNIHTKMKE